MKQKTTAALIWNLADRLGQQVLQFVVAIIVANILFPEDYALVAMLAIFTAVGNLLVESGFGAALIQKKAADDLDFSTVFWFNLAMSIALYLLLMAASPLIAAFFEEPKLPKIAAVVFLALPVNALMLIQNTLLNKQVRFRSLAKVDLMAMLFSSILALGYGLYGLRRVDFGLATRNACGGKGRPLVGHKPLEAGANIQLSAAEIALRLCFKPAFLRAYQYGFHQHLHPCHSQIIPQTRIGLLYAGQ